MAPKPGFYYYDGARAAKVYLLIAVIGAGAYLSKHDFPSAQELYATYLEDYVREGFWIFIYSMRILAIFLLAKIILSAFRKSNEAPDDASELALEDFGRDYSREEKWTNYCSEPHPRSFSQRGEYIAALQRYAAYKGYKAGWIYYRARELWPR